MHNKNKLINKSEYLCSALKVKIIAYVDDHQPGWVRCTFTDSLGSEWYITEKVPVVTGEYLNENSNFPKDGFICCIIEKENNDTVTINIDKPISIETENGETIFTVLKNQITEIDRMSMHK
jgi:hypothetical protein